MDEKTAQALRKTFPADAVGKLPRVTCPDCGDRRKTCTEHSKAKCSECGNYISVRHIHIDYVGHADVTSRLLEVDPEWNWEPKAEDEHGLPVLDTDIQGNPVGLWIKLTVGGVTRLGYGSCPSGQSDAVKVLVGDAVRNAAMRFGVALDLWAKGERADPTAENATASGGQAARRGSRRENAADAGDSASPQPPASAQPNGRTVRPANGQPAAPATDSEPDPDAQPYADEAQQARTLAVLKDVNTRAREAHKLASIIRDPATGKTGGLGQYIGWRKKQLEEDAAALAEFTTAITGMSTDVAEGHMRRICGTGIEDATAAQLRQAAQALTAGVSG